MAKKTKASSNICVEVQLRDGTLSMYIGREVRRDGKQITLSDASWVACTGRRHLFFAGSGDANVEIEPYPDTIEITLPVDGAIFTTWPHPLPRQAK